MAVSSELISNESNWSTASGDNGTKLLLPRLADYHGKQRPLVSTCRQLSKGIY